MFAAGSAPFHKNAVRLRPRTRRWRRPVRKARQVAWQHPEDEPPKPNRAFKSEGDESCFGCGSTHLVSGHWISCTACGLVNGAKLDYRPSFFAAGQETAKSQGKRASAFMPALEGAAPAKRSRPRYTYAERRQQAIDALMYTAAFEFAAEIQRASECTWRNLARARAGGSGRFYMPAMEAAVVIYREHIIRGYPVSLTSISEVVNESADATHHRFQRAFKTRTIELQTTTGFSKFSNKAKKILADLKVHKDKKVVLFDAFCECASLAKGMVCDEYGAAPWSREGAVQPRPKALDDAMKHIDDIFTLARRQWRAWGAYDHRFMPESDARSTCKRENHMEDRMATYRRAQRLMREGAFSVPFAGGLPLAATDKRLAPGTTHTDAGKFLANCSYLKARERIRTGKTVRTNFGVTVVPPSNPRAAAVAVAWSVMRHMRMGLCPCQQKLHGVIAGRSLKDLIRVHGTTKNKVVHAEIQLRLAIRGTMGEMPLARHRRPCMCSYQ